MVRGWQMYALALGVSGVVHGAALGGMGLLSGLERKPNLETVAFEVVEVEPPPPPPEPPPPEPEPPPPEPEPEPVVEPPKPKKAPEPVTEEQPPAEEPPPAEEAPPAETPEIPEYTVTLDGPAVPGGGFKLPTGPGGGSLYGKGKPSGEGKGDGTAAPPAAKIVKMPICTSPDFGDEAYPKQARRFQVEGVVQLLIKVDENGKVVRAKIVKGLGYGLDEKAIELVQTQIKCIPAKTADGRTAGVSLPYNVRFKLP